MRRRERDRRRKMRQDQAHPASARKQIHIRNTQDQREQQKNRVHTGKLFEGANSEGVRALARQIVEISIARQKDRDATVDEKEDRPGERGRKARWPDGGLGVGIAKALACDYASAERHAPERCFLELTSSAVL